MSALGHDDHMNILQRTDIGLDPFPYNGTTTTCDTLWMGVPVVTLAGDRHASRVGASILSNIGLPELIANDELGYIKIAVKLASDRKRLSEMKMKLRSRLRFAPLLDHAGYTRTLEQGYRQIWQNYCNQ
jgi:predicted O-linked N-acetylglucosamine transferase (SPINDLY family)